MSARRWEELVDEEWDAAEWSPGTQKIKKKNLKGNQGGLGKPKKRNTRRPRKDPLDDPRY